MLATWQHLDYSYILPAAKHVWKDYKMDMKTSELHEHCCSVYMLAAVKETLGGAITTSSQASNVAKSEVKPKLRSTLKVKNFAKKG